MESFTYGKNYIFATNLQSADQIYKVVGCPCFPILLNYCNIYAETKSVALQPKLSLRLKHWEIVISLIIFMCGDVEKNSGRYNFAGIIQASFSQNNEKFHYCHVLICLE